MLRILSPVFTSIFLLNACSPNKDVPLGSGNEAVDSDAVSVALKFELADGAKLTSGEKALYEKVQAGQKVSFTRMTDLLIEMHHIALPETLERYPIDENQYASHIRGVSPEKFKEFAAEVTGDTVFKEVDQFKEEIDNNIVKHFGRMSQYWRSAANLFHNFINVSQCYSATTLHEVILRGVETGIQFQAGNHVIVNTPGHIQSGVIVPHEAKSIKTGKTVTSYKLHLVEHTKFGGTFEDKGFVVNLDEAIRIVSANDWAYMEIMKRHLKITEESLNSVRSQMLEPTAAKFGIPLERLEKKVALANAIVGVGPADYDPNLLNSSPLSIGKIHDPNAPEDPEDKDRDPRRNEEPEPEPEPEPEQAPSKNGSAAEPGNPPGGENENGEGERDEEFDTKSGSSPNQSPSPQKDGADELSGNTPGNGPKEGKAKADRKKKAISDPFHPRPGDEFPLYEYIDFEEGAPKENVGGAFMEPGMTVELVNAFGYEYFHRVIGEQVAGTGHLWVTVEPVEKKYFPYSHDIREGGPLTIDSPSRVYFHLGVAGEYPLDKDYFEREKNSKVPRFPDLSFDGLDGAKLRFGVEAEDDPAFALMPVGN